MNIPRALGLAAALTLLSASAFAAPCTDPHSIKSVRNSSPPGHFEYVVFKVNGSPFLPFVASPGTPPFLADGSGLPIAVAGSKFENIRFTGVVWTCEIAEHFALPKTAIKDVKKLGQFEGVVEFVVGIRSRSRFISAIATPSGTGSVVTMKFRK